MHLPKIKAKNNLIRYIRNANCITFMLLALLIITPQNVNATPQDDINKAQNEEAQINIKLSEIRSQKRSLSNDLAAFDLQINLIQSQINISQGQINKINDEIRDTNEKIAAAEKELARQKDLMKEYLRISYINGQTSTFELIAKSNSFSEFIDKEQYLDTMRQDVQNTADKIIELRAKLDREKSELEAKKEEVVQLQSEQIAQRQGIESQRAAKNSLMQSTLGRESVYNKQLSAAQQREADAWRAYEEAIRGSNGSEDSSYTGGSGSGYLIWPERYGTLTQGYGWTDYAKSGAYNGKIHNGLDISCGYPCAIKAAADGYVLDQGFEYNSGGWGNWTAIKHPNGLVTLYGHQKSFAVIVGQKVKQGQTIGYEGSTGFSTGSHLHFSVFISFVLYNTSSYHGPKYEGTVSPYTFL